MLWEQVDDEWVVNKRYKGVDWSGIIWTEEGHVGCPYCMQELGGDNNQDNFMVYGLDEDGLPNGGHCFCCQTTIISVAVALEDEQNKSSLSGKVISSMLSSKSNKDESSNIKQESSVAFGTNSGKLSRDQQKLAEKRLTQEQIDRIHSETSDELKVGFRGLDKDVCKTLDIRWKYDTQSGKVTEMWCPTHIIENGQKVLVGYHIRIVRDRQGNLTKDFRVEGYNGKLCCFFGRQMNVKETLVIVGGQVDVVSAIQMYQTAMSKYPSRIPIVVSTQLGESSTFETIKNEYEWVSKFDKVILCLDQDQAGIAATSSCKEVLDPDITLTANLSLKDVNCYLQPKEGKTAGDFCQDSYWNANPVKSYGIVDSANLLQSAIAAVSKERIKLPPYLHELNEVFKGGIGLQEIVNLISAPSLGKSVFVNEIVLHWLIHSPYKNFIISTEDGAGSYTAKIASRIIGNKILAAETIEERVKLLEDNADLINSYLRDEDGVGRFSILDEIPKSLEDMQQVILQAIKIHGCQVIITDTLSSVIGSRSNQEQEEWMNFLEHTRRNYNVTFINVTHTKKMQDGKALSEGGEATEEMIKGSGAIAQTATVNIILRRNKMADDEIDKNTTYVDVVKNRTIGTTGRGLAKVYYSNVLHTLFDFNYAELNNFFQGVTPEQFKLTQDSSKSTAVSAPKDEYVQGMELEEELPF